ncbi:FAD-linked oxidase C-terminal domain-containing protein [Fulvivirgaceae bacterium BMA12]|uniref:FAD-linked oxidase C-terminal domain-containing protein n=1 Tax=Agaribacillus aureus TaxID=3051825 RepID=A0ABT8LDK6_9BACT|nr:FAD-linked oxidase C-terminal domain-containing protein [Fulvivirgaceae bacterium BMA12]
MQDLNEQIEGLAKDFEGTLHVDKVMRTLYATDASAYREVPTAVALPKSTADIKKLINFASEHDTSLIPRTAGTSLAGQVVGSGIIVDVSKHFTKILELNKEESWVRVQPGVIRDELNFFLKDHGLFFGPETSTANRAMIGGMVGNNSCGSNSVVYGSTRDHLMEVEALLADGSEIKIAPLTKEEFKDKCEGIGTVGKLEQQIYQQISEMLYKPENQKLIRDTFPKPSIPRRNTGYALDLLLHAEPFDGGTEPFNFCKLIAGSEGTLAFITEIKLHVDPLPPKYKGLLCVHFDSIDESLRANLTALKYNPSACELMDHYILECTKKNIEQRQNRFFVDGDPQAILVVELTGQASDEVDQKAAALIQDLKNQKLGYHFPLLTGDDVKKVWNLRKAGLGLLSNIPGDAKAVPVIEDTAVAVEDLPDYIRDFNEILKKHDLYSVHYAHAGSGELHLRPIINLKTAKGNQLFRVIAEEIAALVKKYNGSLSGEHGDGRLRGEFIKYMVGPESYALLESVKRIWDPHNIFNPGKIVDTPSMNEKLRYQPEHKYPELKTLLNFDANQGLLRAAEQCNGSGDCRKSVLTGGTMCPSYMVTRNEKDTTRARANIIREAITYMKEDNPFDSEEIREVMDLCLSCKGCKSECPSNVDVAKLKAEASFQYYESRGIPFRTRMIGNFNKAYQMGSIIPWGFNFFARNKLFSSMIKSVMGFAGERPLPLLHHTTLRKWYRHNRKHNFGLAPVAKSKGVVNLFCDEFTNLNDTEIGIQCIKLLTGLGYDVQLHEHDESGRTYMSKGMLKQARKLAIKNVRQLKDKISDAAPLIGIEPSAILMLRDEYPDLVDKENISAAEFIAGNTFLIDEFIAREIDKGNITKDQFTQDEQLIKLHGHCHQKALSSLTPTKKMLSLPANFTVHLIPSGCCGMAGSFGYEKEHYELSMNIGELVLFPTVRKQPDDVIIAAPGTSCRHQIMDGTQKKALHPVEILWKAMQKKM